MILKHAGEVAKRRVGIEGWEPFSYEAVTGGLLIEGGIPISISKGPRKGQNKWPGPNQKTIVSEQEYEAEFRRYQLDTGKCGNCFGAGEVIQSWHYIDGVTYKKCPACGGTGLCL